jgi:hypothetical protein
MLSVTNSPETEETEYDDEYEDEYEDDGYRSEWTPLKDTDTLTYKDGIVIIVSHPETETETTP